MSLYAFEQTATHGADQAAARAQSSDLRETIRQITQDAQAAAQAAAQDAQVAAHARASAAAQATAQGGRGERQITINEHGIVVGPRAPVPPVPVLAGQPGSYVAPGGMDNVIPPQAVDLAFGFFIMCAVMIIGWPLARAFGRRIENRGSTPVIDAALTGQLQRIEQAVDAMSIEIERISESQRFMAKLQNGSAERAALTSERR
jgi:aspartate ammonia-lyase